METRQPEGMKRLKLTIAYDGAPWSGWQTLPHRQTIQDQVELALGKIAGTAVRIQGSGRTDTGVHALGQVAHADVPASCQLAEDAWTRAINAVLPPSIRILKAERTGDPSMPATTLRQRCTATASGGVM